MTPRPAKRRLRLESLEVRALLAADVGSDLAKAMAAIEVSAPDDGSPVEIDGSLDPYSLNHLFVLAGHGTEALVIDLDRLPSFVTKLAISNFASVTMFGTDSVEYLVAKDVQSLSAPDLSIKAALHLHNVASVELATGGPLAKLTGVSTEFLVRSLDQTTIHSSLQSLRIQSDSKVLSIENRNPNPDIQVAYHPDLLVVAVWGVGSSSDVRLLEPGATWISAPATNGEPIVVDNTPPPGPDEVITGPNGSLILFFNALDERTRVFLAELQKSSPKESRQLVLEFLNHSAADADSATTASRNTRPFVLANPRELEVALQRLPLAPRGEFSEIAASETANEVSADRPGFEHYTDQPIQLTEAVLPLAVELNQPMEIDATWPVAVSPQQPSENPPQFVPLGLGQPEPEQPQLEDSIRAFTDYVVERVTAEFSPGEQSLVLLVDPKPNRPVGVSRGSALDVFGSATHASIASLRQVMS